MKKCTVRKMLERIVANAYDQEIKKFYLVSTDGEIIEADFAIDLVCFAVIGRFQNGEVIYREA